MSAGGAWVGIALLASFACAPAPWRQQQWRHQGGASFRFPRWENNLLRRNVADTRGLPRHLCPPPMTIAMLSSSIHAPLLFDAVHAAHAISVVLFDLRVFCLFRLAVPDVADTYAPRCSTFFSPFRPMPTSDFFALFHSLCVSCFRCVVSRRCPHSFASCLAGPRRPRSPLGASVSVSGESDRVRP